MTRNDTNDITDTELSRTEFRSDLEPDEDDHLDSAEDVAFEVLNWTVRHIVEHPHLDHDLLTVEDPDESMSDHQHIPADEWDDWTPSYKSATWHRGAERSLEARRRAADDERTIADILIDELLADHEIREIADADRRLDVAVVGSTVSLFRVVRVTIAQYRAFVHQIMLGKVYHSMIVVI